MRRSTAAAVGTLTGAALIVGVRLTVATPDVPAAAQKPVAQQSKAPAKKGGAAAASADKSGGKKAAEKPAEKPAEEKEEEDEGAFKNGTYQASTKYVYGKIDISVKVTGGKIAAVDAKFPTAGDSGQINPQAVDALKAATLESQSAEVDAVSGATLTSEAYRTSLQAALDKAGK